jgi:hypothetical protein
MKKSNLNELKRMQHLAGIINESLSSQDIDGIIKTHGFEVTDMESLKNEMEYSDLIDTVAEKIKGSAIGSMSTKEQVPFFLKAKQALLQYGKEKFGSMKESQVNEEQYAEPIVMIQNIVDNWADGGIDAEPAMTRIDKILQGDYEDESGEGYEDEGYQF